MSCENCYTKNSTNGFWGFDNCVGWYAQNYIKTFDSGCYSKNSSNGFGGFDNCACNRSPNHAYCWNRRGNYCWNRENSFRHSHKHSHKRRHSHRRRH